MRKEAEGPRKRRGRERSGALAFFALGLPQSAKRANRNNALTQNCAQNTRDLLGAQTTTFPAKCMGVRRRRLISCCHGLLVPHESERPPRAPAQLLRQHPTDNIYHIPPTATALPATATLPTSTTATVLLPTSAAEPIPAAATVPATAPTAFLLRDGLVPTALLLRRARCLRPRVRPGDGWRGADLRGRAIDLVQVRRKNIHQTVLY